MAWPFLVFAAAVVLLFALQLAPALMALRRLRREHTVEIDIEYTRIGDYHGRAVREGRTQAKSVDAFVGALPAIDGVLFCESDCVVGSEAKVSAIVAMGSLTLRQRVSVGEFADSQGEMTIEDHCSIDGPATSGIAVRLGRDVTLRSVSAPEITTGEPERHEYAMNTGVGPVQLPPSGSSEHWQQLGGDTWLFRGDLKSAEPFLMTGKLVVLGSLAAAAGSIFGDDVKTTGSLILGERCTCRGTLISEQDVELGRGTRFERSIHASGELRLRAGVHGEGPDPVAVFARSRVLMEEGILVRGRIASEGTVISA